MHADESKTSFARLLALYLLVHGLLALWFIFGSSDVGAGARESFPLDDAWIHMVYARSLATGDGFAYNPGEAEAGFTSLLWVVVLVPAMWMGSVFGSVAMWVKLTGVVITATASALLHLVVRELGVDEKLAWLGGLMLALDPGIGFARVAGMEVPLAIAATCLSLVGIWRSDARIAGPALAMSALARPELAVWTALGMAAMLHQLRESEHRLRDGSWLFLPSALGASFWVGFCLRATGRPLPNTYYAKYSTLEGDFGHSADVIAYEILPRIPSVAFGVGLVVVIAGCVRLLRPDPRVSPIARFALAFYPFVFLLLIAEAHQLVEGDAYYWARYAQPIMGLLIIVSILGVDELWNMRARKPKSGLAGPARILVGLYAAIVLLMTPARLIEDQHRYATDSQNILDMQIRVGQSIRDNSDPSDIVAAVDAGAIRYFSERRVIDIHGLNSHRVLWEGYPKVEAELKPRFVALFRAGFVSQPADGNRRLLMAAESAEYTICRCDQEVLFLVERAWSEADKRR